MRRDIISSENAEFQIIQAIKQSRSKRAETGEIFIEGIEAVKMAVRAKLEITRIIVAASRIQTGGSASRPNLSRWARDLISGKPQARVLEMADPLYEKLCDRSEPLEILVTAKMGLASLGELRLPEKPCILLFDRPSDTGNLGSTLRSINALGGDAFFILGHGVDPWDPKVIRSSLGAVFFTPIVSLRSNEELGGFIAEQKKRNGLRVWGTDSGGAVPLNKAGLCRPLLLIIGNEAKGMSVALKQFCDGITGIPLSGDVNSLNAACAAGICLWEVYRNSIHTLLS
ncbi:MAG: RNA methyltransferase [Treponema sp.]|nr:RNA methyltransferase [Treponema sp.]